ncbi:MAG: isomerizing glutamine--fructose-6-phosphate transaminase, partial [Nitrospinae bacterium]|nr:isomerizing glutamine--fructose-6-phosphate transaminase [Nitrospinota bacterium]
MCGISGVVGLKDISNALFETIRNLEYRGYDSCGVALLNKNSIVVKKNIGGVEEFYRKENVLRHKSSIGIAHTRWATHGKVTRENTHPHLSCDGKFAVVHNGIISNYRALRENLTRLGHRFESETDTEVIPHLLEENHRKLNNVEAAFVKTLGELEGTFAIAFVSPLHPGQIFCAKRESPLMLGIGDEIKFVGSDFNSFIDYTKNAVIIDDGEYAIVSRDSYMVKNYLTREEVAKPITKIEWDSETSKKGGFPHYMLKEIHEQPQTVINALDVEDAVLDKVVERIAQSGQGYLVGVGTTYYVAQFGQYMISSLAGQSLFAVSSDEFAALSNVGRDSFVLALSQSGETYDTLTAVKHAKSRGARTAAVVNVMGSSLSR